MAAQRINADFVAEYNRRFTRELALKYRQEHFDNCHHWDFTFLLWHRKFVNQFWEEIGLPRTYAVLTEEADRELYRSLHKTVLQDTEGFVFGEDPNKLDSLTPEDVEQFKLDIAEAMACSEFALDLDFEGVNRDTLSGSFYNLSFSSQVEQFHDMGHGETGRGMRSVRTAGGDQCFFPHHSFVDLLFETWLHDNPEAQLPVDAEHFARSAVLQGDYASFDELEQLWAERHFSDDDYKLVRRISAPVVRQVVAFDEIRHDVEYRRVIMFHRDHGELGRFAIFTGELQTCAGCARKQYHSGQFLLRRLVPLSEIVWNINNRFYMGLEDAVAALSALGMSRPYVVSF